MAALFNKQRTLTVEELPDALRQLLQETHQEKSELEAVLDRLSQAAEVVTGFEEKLSSLGDRLGEVERRSDGLGKLAQQAGEIQNRMKSVEAAHEAAEERAQELLRSVANARGSVSELNAAFHGAQDLRGELESMASADGKLGKLRAFVDDLAKQLEGDLAGNQEQLFRRLDEADKRMAQIAEGVQQASSLGDRVEQFTRRHQATEDRIAEIGDNVNEIQEAIPEIRRSLQQAQEFRSEVSEIGGPSGPVVELSARLDGLRNEFVTLKEDVHAVRESEDGFKRAQEEALNEFRSATAQSGRIKDQVDAASQQLAKMEVTLAELSKLREVATRTEQHVGSLNSLADHVIQKVGALEQQREVVDRAAAQAARLDDFVWEFENRLKKVQQDSKQIKKTQKNLTSIEQIYQKAEARISELKVGQAAVEKDGVALEQRLGSLRDGVRAELDRFALEKRGLTSVNEEVTAIRNTLSTFEQRLHELEGSSRALVEAQSRADELMARLTTISADVGRVEEHGERVRAVQGTLERVTGDVGSIKERVDELQAAQPALNEIAEQVATMRSLSDHIKEATEQLNAGRAELERSHVAQTETRKWIANTDAKIKDIDRRTASLSQTADEVDRLRTTVERFGTLSKELEERQNFMSQLEVRLGQLGSMSTALNDRMKAIEERRTMMVDLEARSQGLKERLDDTDTQVHSLLSRTADVGGLEKRLVTVTDDVRLLAERTDAIKAGIGDAEVRAAEADALSERLDRISSQLEEREQTLDRTIGELDRASTLRQDVADSIRQLDDQGRKVSDAIVAANQQAANVAKLAEQVESRVGNLRFAEKRMTQFEEKLMELQQSERNLEQSIQGMAERQKSVDAVRAELTGIFETVEQTLTEVRAIEKARTEVEQTREVLSDVLARAEHVDALAASVDRRRSEIDHAEQRMAQLEGLLSDVRSSLETLQSQKALVDLVIEKAGQLTFQTKEAEALIKALREERDLASRVYEAVVEIRRDEQRAG